MSNVSTAIYVLLVVLLYVFPPAFTFRSFTSRIHEILAYDFWVSNKAIERSLSRKLTDCSFVPVCGKCHNSILVVLLFVFTPCFRIKVLSCDWHRFPVLHQHVIWMPSCMGITKYCFHSIQEASLPLYLRLLIPAHCWGLIIDKVWQKLQPEWTSRNAHHVLMLVYHLQTTFYRWVCLHTLLRWILFHYVVNANVYATLAGLQKI